MAQKLYEESYISAIASKIRAKAGLDTKYKTSEMPVGIDAVYNKGYSDGAESVGSSEGGITPTGTIEITENGTFDVTQYASALVNVMSSGDGGNADFYLHKLFDYTATGSVYILALLFAVGKSLYTKTNYDYGAYIIKQEVEGTPTLDGIVTGLIIYSPTKSWYALSGYRLNNNIWMTYSKPWTITRNTPNKGNALGELSSETAAGIYASQTRATGKYSIYEVDLNGASNFVDNLFGLMRSDG